jgi:hypothetical protein
LPPDTPLSPLDGNPGLTRNTSAGLTECNFSSTDPEDLIFAPGRSENREGDFSLGGFYLNVN